MYLPLYSVPRVLKSIPFWCQQVHLFKYISFGNEVSVPYKELLTNAQNTDRLQNTQVKADSSVFANYSSIFEMTVVTLKNSMLNEF